MREFNRERFMQLLHEVPESKPFFHEPRHNPYIQSLMDKLKEEGSLDLAAIDWNSFEIADVTIPYFQERAGSDANGWIKGGHLSNEKSTVLSVTPPCLLLRWQYVRLRI